VEADSPVCVDASSIEKTAIRHYGLSATVSGAEVSNVTGDGILNFDSYNDFRLTERFTFQFRAKAFHLLNSPTLEVLGLWTSLRSA